MDLNCYTPSTLLNFFLIPDSVSWNCRVVLDSPAAIEKIAPMTYLILFFSTCVLESPFYLWALRTLQLSKLDRMRIIGFCNLATHPAVCFLFPYLVSLISGNYALSLLIGEVFAILVEGTLLWKIWKLPARRAFGFSLLANLFSWRAGVFLYPYIF